MVVQTYQANELASKNRAPAEIAPGSPLIVVAIRSAKNTHGRKMLRIRRSLSVTFNFMSHLFLFTCCNTDGLYRR